MGSAFLLVGIMLVSVGATCSRHIMGKIFPMIEKLSPMRSCPWAQWLSLLGLLPLFSREGLRPLGGAPQILVDGYAKNWTTP